MAELISTNVDAVIKQLARLEQQATNQIVQEARNGLKAVARKTLPLFRAITPVETGELKSSLRVRSRSKRGLTNVTVTWWPNEYGAYVNNWKKSPHRFIFTNKFKMLKQTLDAQGQESIVKVYEKFLKANGIQVKRS